MAIKTYSCYPPEHAGTLLLKGEMIYKKKSKNVKRKIEDYNIERGIKSTKRF